jgi:poly(3-hydroxybutyrate) depolymerase
MGHFWPGGMSHLLERVVGKSSNKISATDLIWDFFTRHPPRQAVSVCAAGLANCSS